MTQLILQGGASFPDSQIMDAVFFSVIDRNKKMLYLPIAMNDTTKYIECYSYIKTLCHANDFHKVEMWGDLQDKDERKLNDFGSIYIGGGNTWLLMHKLRQSGFDRIISNFISRGLPVCGGSAGAIIFGEKISTTDDENAIGLTNNSGLGILANISLWPHYTDSQKNNIYDYVKHTGTSVLALPETSAAYFMDGKIQAVGKDPIYFFGNNFEKVKVIEINSFLDI